MVENTRIAVGIFTLSIIISQIYNYFRFRRSYCYFRLSVVLAITFFELPWSKTPGCSWKRTHFVLLLKTLGAFFAVTRVRKNRSKLKYDG